MMITAKFTVNGRQEQTGAPADTPLLYVLRNDLGLKGTRFGCGAGDCGACMVIVDGRAEKSCQLPVGGLGAASVETIESLLADAADGTPSSPVIRALIARQAGQCGYCLSGIAMSVTAMLRSRPQLQPAEIGTALDGNLCRCGAHARILAAVLDAAGMEGLP